MGAECGPWIVQAAGPRRLGGFDDASWSPGGLFVVAAKGRRLTTLEPDGDERWTRIAPGRVATPRWSPDGKRVAYRSGSDLYVAVADNTDAWVLDRAVRPTPPAWRFGQADNSQVLAYARGNRIHVVPADPPRRRLFRQPPGRSHASSGGAPTAAASSRCPGVRSASTMTRQLLRSIRLAGRLRRRLGACSGRRRLALIAAGAGCALESASAGAYRPPGAPQAAPGGLRPALGLTWSIDGRVLVAGLPQADQWLFLRMSGRGGLVSVRGIRSKFRGGRPAHTGAFPRPAGWCYADLPDPGASRFPPCSAGASPGP